MLARLGHHFPWATSSVLSLIKSLNFENELLPNMIGWCVRGGPSPRLPLSPARWPLSPQWALRGFGLMPYKLPRAGPAPFPCLSLEYHPNPKSNCCQCSCPKVFESGQSPSWLTVASLMLLPPQCGFTPGGLASQLPLPVRNTLASKASLTPRKRRAPPPPPAPF